MTSRDKKSLSPDTVLLHAGRSPEHHFGAVNMPVYRASTILFDTYDAFVSSSDACGKKWHEGGLTYGRRGTPLTCELASAIATLEGGHQTFLTGSGVSAIATVMLSFLKPNDHVIISDSVYTPTRSWAEHYGKSIGIQVSYLPASRLSEAEIASYFQDNTRLVMLESPGSLTFEIADVPLIANIAHARGAVVAIDNTWGSGVYFKAFEKGCDISIQAGTKYMMGHSDGCFGTITCNEKTAKIVSKTHGLMGQCLDGDTSYLAMRGLRTLGVRLKQHQESTLTITSRLENHPLVDKVFCPALPSSPDYALWKRDFTGCTGLFSFTLQNPSVDKTKKFVNSLRLFGIGFSWGGFESLVMPCLADNLIRNHTGNVHVTQEVIRLHIGLENVDDLWHDIDTALMQTMV